MIKIIFYVDGVELDWMRFHTVPSIGDYVRRKGGVYEVIGVIWDFDNSKDEEHHVIVELSLIG